MQAKTNEEARQHDHQDTTEQLEQQASYCADMKALQARLVAEQAEVVAAQERMEAMGKVTNSKVGVAATHAEMAAMSAAAALSEAQVAEARRKEEFSTLLSRIDALPEQISAHFHRYFGNHSYGPLPSHCICLQSPLYYQLAQSLPRARPENAKVLLESMLSDSQFESMWRWLEEHHASCPAPAAAPAAAPVAAPVATPVAQRTSAKST
jgi:hypothetical protein